MQCQRRILGIRWSDFVTNSSVAEKTGLPDIRAVIGDRRLALFGPCFGHVRRLPEGAPAHGTTPCMCLLNCSPAPRQSLIGGESQEDHEAAGCVVFSRTHKRPEQRLMIVKDGYRSGLLPTTRSGDDDYDDALSINITVDVLE